MSVEIALHSRGLCMNVRLKHNCNCLLAIVIWVAGCASNPEDVDSYYVSYRNYIDLDCSALEAEATALNSRIAGVFDEAATERVVDNTLVAASIIVFWPALFFLNGNSATQLEYARLQGEFEAIEEASRRNSCNIMFIQGDPNS